MNSEVLSFDAMPQMVATILKKLETLEQKFDALQSNNNVEADAWFSLQNLCNYLPNHPAEQTVYGWTSNRTIPYHKNGKSIIFRKLEINNWLMQTSRKSVNDIYNETRAYVANSSMIMTGTITSTILKIVVTKCMSNVTNKESSMGTPYFVVTPVSSHPRWAKVVT